MANDDKFTITIGDTTYNTSSSDTITIDTAYTTDTGSEYTFNVDPTFGVSYPLDNSIDPERVKDMSEHYPALKKAWDNFFAIYKMVDQDYKGNHEKDEEIPF